MAAYIIAQISIDDPQGYQAYLDGFGKIFDNFQGRLLVTSKQEVEVLEGDWVLPRTVVIEFPDVRRARAWYRHPDYQAIIHHRWKNARTNMILVDGALE